MECYQILASIVFQFDVHHNQIDSRSSVSSLTGDGQDGTYKVNGRKIPLTVYSILFLFYLGSVLLFLTHQSRIHSLKPCHILKSLSITTTVGISFGVEYIYIDVGVEIKWITPKGGEFIYLPIDGKFMALKHPKTEKKKRTAMLYYYIHECCRWGK